MELYRTRGTIAGLQRYVEIYTGTAPVIRELFLERPGQPAFLGIVGSTLGSGFALSRPSVTTPPPAALIAAYAHRFTVLVYLEDACDAETLLPVVDRIVTVNKPAHTIHSLVAVYPDARVGVQSMIGMDLVVGGGVAVRSGSGGGLGRDTVLRDGRPPYGPPGLTLP
jgi:hypothetical protein